MSWESELRWFKVTQGFCHSTKAAQMTAAISAFLSGTGRACAQSSGNIFIIFIIHLRFGFADTDYTEKADAEMFSLANAKLYTSHFARTNWICTHQVFMIDFTCWSRIQLPAYVYLADSKRNTAL